MTYALRCDRCKAYAPSAQMDEALPVGWGDLSLRTNIATCGPASQISDKKRFHLCDGCLRALRQFVAHAP